MSLYPLIKLKNSNESCGIFFSSYSIPKQLDEGWGGWNTSTWKSGPLGSSLFHLALSVSQTQWQELPLRTSWKIVLEANFNKTQYVWIFTGGICIKRVSRRCWKGPRETGLCSSGSGACGQNHQLLPDVIRSLQQLCLYSPGTHKYTAWEGIRAQNMAHNQKE